MKRGFVALVGRPNAGKSTLLNGLVGEKLAIVSDKPQTTRNRIAGVRHFPEGEVVFIDTPGIHRPLHRLNVRMVDAALETLRDADVVVAVVDASEPSGAGDRFLMDIVKNVKVPRVLALNKVDRVEKEALLPRMAAYHESPGFADIVPLSALRGENVDRLIQVLLSHLPEGTPVYPEDYLTDQPERFFVAELVREQVLRQTHDELPFSTAVVVDKFEEGPLLRLYCTILVERDSQKPILIGKGGAAIKAIGTAAREELERFFQTKVFLDLHVKVRARWREDERTLDELGVEGRRKRRRT
ncbi:MAG TPA: GTPase Era [Vicinamibacterales bacterium]|jgi:GTPase|nr:GTPase Era [Vicinamibacterales bacterium]